MKCTSAIAFSFTVARPNLLPKVPPPRNLPQAEATPLRDSPFPTSGGAHAY